MNTSSGATAETVGLGDEGHSRQEHRHDRHGCGMSGKRKWSGLEIAAMVGGFIVFWPLGLLALGLKLIKGEMWPGASESVAPWNAYKTWRDSKGGSSFGFATRDWASPRSSGNTAFDAYKKEQLERLEAERRKLEDEQKAFAEYLVKLRQAKDKDEFDRFVAERNASKPSSEGSAN